MHGHLNLEFCGKPVTQYVVDERTNHIFKIIAVTICVSFRHDNLLYSAI